LGKLIRVVRIGNVAELRVLKNFTHIISMSKTSKVLQNHCEELHERYSCLSQKSILTS
jgi:hypothetical protein